MPKSTQPLLSGNGKTPILVVGILVLAFALGGVIWVVLRSPKTSENQTPQQQGTGTPTTSVNLPEPVISQAEDDDHDGLTNDEERELGTNARDADSDEDGLSDKAEARVYTTDPLNPDTDTDGIRDGEEVKNGSNPKGEGLLLDLETAIQSINAPQPE